MKHWYRKAISSTFSPRDRSENKSKSGHQCPVWVNGFPFPACHLRRCGFVGRGKLLPLKQLCFEYWTLIITLKYLLEQHIFRKLSNSNLFSWMQDHVSKHLEYCTCEQCRKRIAWQVLVHRHHKKKHKQNNTIPHNSPFRVHSFQKCPDELRVPDVYRKPPQSTALSNKEPSEKKNRTIIYRKLNIFSCSHEEKKKLPHSEASR